MRRTLKCGRYELPICERTLVMGVLNITPDSFSDGNKFFSAKTALRQAEKIIKDGADIIDIGGESTRPYAAKVTEKEELRRVIPIIKNLSQRFKIPISIDTYKATVAREAIRAGACIVNDISALKGDDRMADVVAETDAPIILMHMKGTPRTMQKKPVYKNVIREISSFLKERAEFAISHEINKDKIIIDPGIGFGKRLEDNLDIIQNLDKFKVLGYPVLIGPSRKSFIGTILDLPVEERLEGTLAAVAVSVLNGADIVRVHDVKESRRVVQIADAINRKS